AVCLKLFPKPAHRETCFVAVPSTAAAITLLARMQAATGGEISAFELVPRLGVELVIDHIPDARDPLLAPSPWYVLLQGSSAAPALRTHLEEALRLALEERLVTDAVFAESEAQRHTLWSLREQLSEAQKREGASIKHDISVPISSIPTFLDRATKAVMQVV